MRAGVGEKVEGMRGVEGVETGIDMYNEKGIVFVFCNKIKIEKIKNRSEIYSQHDIHHIYHMNINNNLLIKTLIFQSKNPSNGEG